MKFELGGAMAPAPAVTTALDDLRLGWRPIVARDRRPLGLRLEVRPRPGATITISAAVRSIVDVWSCDAGAAFPRSSIVIAPLGMPADRGLDQAEWPSNVALEVGLPVLQSQRLLLETLHSRRVRLVLRLEDGESESAGAQALFTHVIEGPRRRGTGAADPRRWVRDAQTRADVETAIAMGASANIGWPLEEPAAEASAGLEPTRRAVLDLVRLIQSDADVSALERAFKQEPGLTYMLLALVNTPGYAPAGPIASIGHAVMLLGYKRLVRWLVLLLGVSSTDSWASPLVHLAVQRGFFLEALAGRSNSMRDDLFAVGAFSLLDRITGHTHERLFRSASLPRLVLEAVRAHQGAYGAYLALAEVIERGDVAATERAAQIIGAPLARVNAALLHSLAAADALQATPVSRS
jgi:EAL and modified HD-GYP domain-containing signal transduction protein